MRFPIAIDFHRAPASAALRADVIERVQDLERLIGDILACRVVVEASPGCRSYGVHVRVTMPCVEIEAGGKPLRESRRQDPFLCVGQTFDVLEVRMRDFARRRCRTCTRYRNAGGAP